MNDTTICINEECPLKGECCRYNVIPNEYSQSYAKFEPDEEGICDFKC